MPLLVLLAAGLVFGCGASLSPELQSNYLSRTLFTCCNIYYEGNDLYDANYRVGALVPLGTRVKIVGFGRGSVTFQTYDKEFTLHHKYGVGEESFQAYLDKVLIPTDPTRKLSSYPTTVQEAIREGRVEAGMTREQVILSLGYPPTHETGSLTDRIWTYWYSSFVTYQVVFDDTGVVARIVGGSAPSRNRPVRQGK